MRFGSVGDVSDLHNSIRVGPESSEDNSAARMRAKLRVLGFAGCRMKFFSSQP